MEQRVEGGEERHVQGRLFLAAESSQPVPKLLGWLKILPLPVVSLHGWARLVSWKFEDEVRARQLFLPVGEARFQNFVTQPKALPESEVRILNRQFGERRGLPIGKGFI